MPVLFEDQPVPQNRMAKFNRNENDSSPFKLNDVTSRFFKSVDENLSITGYSVKKLLRNKGFKHNR